MTSSDIQVQGSNDWSIASKLSTVNAGYYEDQYIKYFVQKPIKRSALIHRGYCVRAKAMEFVFEKFLSAHPDSQIISFGAGFDSSFFVLRHKRHTNCKYVEIDFPDVVDRKKELIKSKACLSELATEKNGYHLIKADLRDLPSLSNLLLDSKILDTSVPTLMVSECAITYMDEPSSGRLIEWCSKTFANAVFAVYEQIRPCDGFGRVMQRHFNQLGIPLLSLPVYQDRNSQRQRYLRTGWADCQVYDINEFVSHLIPSDELRRVRQLEPFDEYEGFHEKCSHYIILNAAKGSCPCPLPAREAKCDASFCQVKSWRTEKSTIQRYGHASCADSKGNVWITGGFGARPQGHGRLDDLLCSRPGANEPEPKMKERKLGRMHHSAHSIAVAGKDFVLIYGGRTHPAMALSDVALVRIDGRDVAHVDWIDPPESAQWPEPRWRHASATLGPSTLFIGAGRNGNRVLADCWTAQVSDDEPRVKWSRLADLPTGRHSATASFWKGRVVLFGGLDDTEAICSAPLIVKEAHQPDWQFPPWTGPEPSGRYSHEALVTSDDRLVLVGGVSASFSPGVCVIRLTDWNFVEYSFPIQDIERPVILAGHTSIAEHDNERTTIKCWGGGGLCFSFGTHLNSVTVTIEL